MKSTLSEKRDGPLLGCQVPRLRHVPEYVTSAGIEAIEIAARAGLALDEWQQLVLVDALGERADGKWAAFEVGLVVPRQNGKGSLLEARELAGLLSFGERLLIHSAHEQATSSEHFRRLLNLIEGVPEFERRVLRAPKGKGAEAIELRGGQRIMFKTRTGGGGRGLTGDFVALDEAMILPVATTGALVPTMAARSITGNPQLWYAGSAVDRDVHEHGVVLARVRTRGIKGAARMAYFEWSADAESPNDLSPTDAGSPEMWAQANPGLGIRIAEEHVANEADGALGPRQFAVERLGVGDWPPTDELKGQGLDPVKWAALVDEASKVDGEMCFAFDMKPDRSAGAISVAGRRADDLAHLEVIEHRPGTGWMVDRIAELSERHDAPVVCDQAGPAASLISELEDRGVDVRTTTTSEHAQACGTLFDAVDQATVRHLGDSSLESAVRGALKRPLGDSWAWSRRSSAVDISPLVASTLALWGLNNVSRDAPFHFEVFS
jgi:hypothetical protein